MSTCPKCNASIAPEDKFCGHCGSDLHEAADTPGVMTEHSLDVTEVKFRLGLVYYKKGNIEGAVKLWNEVLSLNPDHQDARTMLAQANARQQSGDDRRNG